MSDLSIKATKGMLWSLAESISVQAVQLLISIVLARLLLPEQFGLIGMLTLFIALAQSLLDSGFGSALIQKKDADNLDACSIFFFNLLVGIILTLLLVAAAPFIGRFFNQPLLMPLARILAFNIIINAFSLVPTNLLIKRMDFKALVKVSVISAIASGMISIALAVGGMGVWSLAIQSVLASLLRALLLWQASRWRPSLLFSGASLKNMFSYGSRMMMSGMLETLFLNIYQPLIGKVYTATDVGYFTRAQILQSTAIQPAGTVLGRVIFPALSLIQDDPVRMKQAVRKIITTTIFFHFPLMVGLIVVAEPLIVLLMTDRWAPCIPFFQILCVTGILYPLQIINGSILSSTGKSNIFFRLEIIKKLMIVIVIAITIHLGIMSMLYGQVITTVLAYFLNSYYSRKLIGYSFVQQLRDVYLPLLMSLLMGVSMHLIGTTIDSLLPRLLIQTLAGIIIYLFLNFSLGRSLLIQLIQIARQVIHLQMAS